MLFTQIIAFIAVMVLFEAYPLTTPELSAWASFLMCSGLLAWFGIYCRLSTTFFLRRLAGPKAPADPARAASFLELRLNLGAILSFGLMITALDLKYYLMSLPLAESSQTVAGLLAALVYLVNLLVVWAALHPVERQVFQRAERLGAHVWARLRFVTPVVFPWLAAMLLRDFLVLLWPGGEAWLDTTWGDLTFLVVFLFLVALFFPPLVRSWWGCRPLEPGRVRRVIETVLEHLGVEVNEILSWPLMEGRVLTAGILGVTRRFRYLLITPALAQALDNQELAGVVAHEAGHVKFHHLLKYFLFFLGFFAAAFAITEPLNLLYHVVIYFLSGTAWGAAFLMRPTQEVGWFNLILALPVVVCLVIYLRFVMGYFMRHFERQADLYSLAVMGSAEPLIGSLEKIALLSGNVREMPSWHHFSIAQRVETLEFAAPNPGAALAAHAARLKRAVGIFLVGLVGLLALGQGLEWLAWDQSLARAGMVRLLEDKLLSSPHDPGLMMSLGVLHSEQGHEQEALALLTGALTLAPEEPEVLNSLAWLLATAEDPAIHRPREAVFLAQKAVRLSPKPHIWDTLAEAYFQNGQPARAVAAARTALLASRGENESYYREQLSRFEESAR
ncbi:MAG: M48 family metalloprotease [Deltaproteobacteria bacterium]|nr:M48 family metalloprotease [Deltaproteobacteria bacterium]